MATTLVLIDSRFCICCFSYLIPEYVEKDFCFHHCQCAFRRENPLQIDRKTDPQTRDVTYYLAHVPETPPELPLIAGDALHNFRSTLDHLAWKLVEATGKLPTVKTGFPIFDSEADYRSRSPKKVEGMRAITKERIDNLRPYKGGYNDLWILHRLDIIDKHRLPVLFLSSGGTTPVGSLAVHGAESGTRLPGG